MIGNPRNFIADAPIGQTERAAEAAPAAAPLDLDKLPAGVVSGPALIDFSATPSPSVRAGVSMSVLFASRVATKAMKAGDDEDDWLASYTSSLGNLGFALAGTAMVRSRFKKTGLHVHQAIIPFLTIAFGGAAVGPVILAALRNLQEKDAGAPWITLFDRQSRRFDAQEMHFAAVGSTDTDTSIRYAIARLHVATAETSLLFFRLSQAEANFESATTTMSANNSLLAVTEPDLRLRLGQLTRSFIASAEI